MISNINYVKEVLGDLKAKKKFGQNFLIDSNIVDKIAKNACDESQTTIEIGPGLGSLTEMLLHFPIWKKTDTFSLFICESFSPFKPKLLYSCKDIDSFESV